MNETGGHYAKLSTVFVTIGFYEASVCMCVCVCAQACLTLCDPMDCSLPRLLCPWNFPYKNTGVGCHFLLQGIFPTQVLIPCLWHVLHWQTWILYP